MIPKELDMLDHAAYRLLFDVRRSVRYHDKRAAFMERVHRITNALTILLAGSVLFDMARPGDTPGWLQALALLGALLSVADLVMGWTKIAGLHRDLQRRFAQLELRMVSGPAQGDCWINYGAERLMIEMDEPTPYLVLDTICHNELLHAQGFGRESAHRKPVNTWQRLTCQIWPWSQAYGH
ncbi:MAG: hypothetical protein ACKO0Z_05235 [Betaproteobacteria bacterium]